MFVSYLLSEQLPFVIVLIKSQLNQVQKAGDQSSLAFFYSFSLSSPVTVDLHAAQAKLTVKETLFATSVLE